MSETQNNTNERSLLDTVIKAISDKKARDIVVYDTVNKSPFMDTMIVATSDNVRMNDAIAQNIKDELQLAGYTGDYKVEGAKESRWILVDLKDIVVHLFVADERDLYQIDRLYEECPTTRYE
jgi:ribosome-associated protein